MEISLKFSKQHMYVDFIFFQRGVSFEDVTVASFSLLMNQQANEMNTVHTKIKKNVIQGRSYNEHVFFQTRERLRLLWPIKDEP